MIILKDVDTIPNINTLEGYLQAGGYRALRHGMEKLDPETITEYVKDSGLRGRGGAGFPTGLKWSFVPKDTGKPIYLCCNADESEPGTFKDREIILKKPHILLEGIAIASYALDCHHCFIYIRGEFAHEAEILRKAIREAEEQHFLGKNILGSDFHLNVVVYRGAGAYICGEETGLIESIEGKRGYPRIKPPFPASVGVNQCPTVVNNVETLAFLPFIVLEGPDAYKRFGSENNYGTKLYCLSGHLNTPGVYELEMGVYLDELIEKYGGGIPGNRKLKAVIPGGSSVPVLKADEVHVRMDFDSLQKAGTMLGSAGVIVMDDTTSMVDAALNLAKFYAHESCGQCTPCREGTGWLVKLLKKIKDGRGDKNDPDLVVDICNNMEGNTICPLADAAAAPIRSIVQKFRDEFDQRLG